MNGRIFDYNVGRFLGVDPVFQFPTNSQSANPYSYILNNPMAGTDPTGYSCNQSDQSGEHCGDTQGEAQQDSVRGDCSSSSSKAACRTANERIKNGEKNDDNTAKGGKTHLDVNEKEEENENENGGTNVGYNPNSCLKMSCHGADVSEHRQGTDAELLPLYLTAMGIEILVPVLPKALTITKIDKLADAGEAGLKLLRTGDDAVSTLQYASTISKQKQMRHIAGSAPANKSYLNSLDDAQKVLDNFNSGNYKLISENIKQSTVTIRVENVTGRYINIGNPNGLPDVNKVTNIFMIQSLKSPKIVPVNPNKGL